MPLVKKLNTYKAAFRYAPRTSAAHARLSAFSISRAPVTAWMHALGCLALAVAVVVVVCPTP